jgi:hypothetical protein
VIRLVELTGGAAYSDLERGEVQLHPIDAFSRVPHIVELYLVHEYLHFVLHHNGIPAKLHHCWMARDQSEFNMALDFLARVKEAEPFQKALIMYANKTVRRWRRECQDAGVWWHPLVSGVGISRLAN